MAACIAVILGFLLLRNYLWNARELDARLQRWQREHALAPERVEQLRALEIEFHGSTDLFWPRPRTPAEHSRHDAEIAGLLGNGNSARPASTGGHAEHPHAQD